MNSISISDFNKLKNVNVIDIRSIEKFNNNHIEGAINIPINLLISNPSKYLIKMDKYYIYCQRGIQSQKACLILQKQGYNVVNIQGGYEAWILNKYDRNLSYFFYLFVIKYI